jgi:hypothetical protein
MKRFGILLLGLLLLAGAGAAGFFFIRSRKTSTELSSTRGVIRIDASTLSDSRILTSFGSIERRMPDGNTARLRVFEGKNTQINLELSFARPIPRSKAPLAGALPFSPEVTSATASFTTYLQNESNGPPWFGLLDHDGNFFFGTLGEEVVFQDDNGAIAVHSPADHLIFDQVRKHLAESGAKLPKP